MNVGRNIDMRMLVTRRVGPTLTNFVVIFLVALLRLALDRHLASR